MPGTFTVTLDQVWGQGSVKVTLTSYNNYHGTVTMTYTTDPGSPAVVPDKLTEDISVPKNGASVPVTRVIQMNGVTSCHFYADGTDGSVGASDDCEVTATAHAGGHRPRVEEVAEAEL